MKYEKFWKKFFLPYSIIFTEPYSLLFMMALVIGLVIVPKPWDYVIIGITAAYWFVGRRLLTFEQKLEWYGIVPFDHEEEEETAEEAEEPVEEVECNTKRNVVRFFYPTHPDTEVIFHVSYTGSREALFNSDLVNFGMEVPKGFECTLNGLIEFTLEWFRDRGYEINQPLKFHHRSA